VERVRLGAPELLIGLDPRRAADDARPRHRDRAEAQGWTRTPAPAQPRIAGTSARAPANSVGTPAPFATAATATATAATTAAAADTAAPAATASVPASSRTAGATPPPSRSARPHGVLRWTERARRLAEQEAIGSRHQPARPEPPPPDPARPRFAESSPRGPELSPDQAPAPRPSDPVPSRLGEDPVRWPAATRAPQALPDLPLFQPPGASIEPERWPELPPDQAPGELEEGLLRRLERRRRIAREQRGD